MVYASLCAGSFTLGSFKSSWIPRRTFKGDIIIAISEVCELVPTCFMVIAGFHDFSSSRIDRQTVPEGYTLGWNNGGVNLPRMTQL